MHLVSNFHDVYDSIAHSYKTKTPVYARYQEEIFIDIYKYNKYLSKEQIAFLTETYDTAPTVFYSRKVRKKFSAYYRFVSYSYPKKADIISLCGRLYLFYDKKNEEEIINDNCCKVSFIPLAKKQETSKSKRNILQIWHKTIDRKKLDDIHVALKTPVFLLQKKGKNFIYGLYLTKNIALSQYPLIKSPFELYQTIEQYLNSTLSENKEENFVLSDKLKLQTHGMDKLSFKQHGPKERKRRK